MSFKQQRRFSHNDSKNSNYEHELVHQDDKKESDEMKSLNKDKDRDNDTNPGSNYLSKDEKQIHKDRLLAKFSVGEILTESIGQNLLQLYILRVSLGQHQTVLPSMDNILVGGRPLDEESWNLMNFTTVGIDGTQGKYFFGFYP